MLYHVSNIRGLKVLEPRVSTHGKPYVYAINNMVTALLFGASKDDFDFLMDENELGIPVVYECYPDAFEKIYSDKSCSVYGIDESGFMSGKTGWNPELVNENEVKVLYEINIDNLYEKLIEEENNGRLIINRFENLNEYKKIISNHIVDRLIRFEILDSPIKDDRLLIHFGNIINSLKDILSGKYL